MAATLFVLAVMSGRGGPSLVARLTSWDAAYYGDIAKYGYPHHLVIHGGRVSMGAIEGGGKFAFSPLYPVIVAAVHVLGVSVQHALLVVAAASGIAASVLVHLLARQVIGNRRAGYAACALLGAMPMAITLQMGYAESLAIALGAASLLAVTHRRWWWAASFACLAGLTRPSGGVVAVAIPVAAWSMRRARTVDWRRIAAATVVGLAGLPLFWLYVWARTGVVDGWFVVQKLRWHTRFDFGAQTIAFLRGTLGYGNLVVASAAYVSIVMVVIGCLFAVWRGKSPPLVAVSIAAVGLALGSSNFWFSKPRGLLAAFPLVVLAARPLSRWPTSALSVAIASGVVLSAWVGAYWLTRWPYAI